jgi:hypothetical protein
VVALVLAPSLALADESLASAVQRRVKEGIIAPLAEKENARSRFSRVRIAPRERRVRVTDSTTTLDPGGRPYVAFAIDVRYGEEWRENDVVGCAYPQTGALFVKRGDEIRPAGILLGEKADPVQGTCVPAKARS